MMYSWLETRYLSWTQQQEGKRQAQSWFPGSQETKQKEKQRDAENKKTHMHTHTRTHNHTQADRMGLSSFAFFATTGSFREQYL